MKLLLIEDNESIILGLEYLLQEEGFRFDTARTAAEAERAVIRERYDLALLDISLPDGDGFRLWSKISREQELPVIFLTVRNDPCDMVCGFQSGADDYVVKPFELEVLYLRIQALLRRAGNASGRYLSCGGIVMDQNRRMVSCQGKELALSAAEYQLLLCLMQNKGRTVTREKILEQVWDVNGNYVNDNTLTVTMKRLRDKLCQPECLKTVRSVGYRMEDTL